MVFGRCDSKDGFAAEDLCSLWKVCDREFHYFSILHVLHSTPLMKLQPTCNIRFSINCGNADLWCTLASVNLKHSLMDRAETRQGQQFVIREGSAEMHLLVSVLTPPTPTPNPGRKVVRKR